MNIIKNKFVWFAFITIVFTLSCAKEEEKDLNPDLRTAAAFCEELAAPNASKVRVFSITLNEGFANVVSSEAGIGEGSDFKLNGNGVNYAYMVTEWGLGTSQVSITKNYKGSLNDNAFIKNEKNIIRIVRNGDDWKLLVNGKSEDIGGSGAVPTTTNPTTGTEIFKTVRMAGGAKDRQIFEFDLPANVKKMEVRTKETPPDMAYNHADLFVRRGSEPFCNDDPFISWTADTASLNNNREQDVCYFNNPQSGKWFVMLYNYNGTFYESNLVITITR